MAQFARPDSDVTKGNWDDPNGNNNDILYDDIEEETPNDSDYIESPDDPSSEMCEVGLSDVSDPESSSNHTIRVRYQTPESGGGQPASIDFTIALMENGTERASWTEQPDPPSTWATASYTLTTEEADSIQNYANLRLRFTANKTGGARSTRIEVSWAEFEVPDASQTFYQDVGGGAMSIAGTLAKKTSIGVGEYSMAIAGTLTRLPKKNVGGGSMVIAGDLKKKTSIEVGGYAITIAGTLEAGLLVVQNVGQGAVAIAGTLTTVPTWVAAVGGGAVSIAGTLLKKTSISVGAYAMTITGTLSKFKLAFKDVGSGVVNIVGNLGTQKISGGAGQGGKVTKWLGLAIEFWRR